MPTHEGHLVVAVIGLGYVGLPQAQAACGPARRVIGFDINTTIIDRLLEGHSHVDDIDDSALQTMLDNGFTPTSREQDLDSANVFVICVPTPLAADGTPDLSAMISASEVVARHLSPEDLVVLESTTFPGTTDEIVRPIIENSGLSVGREVFLAFSPERVDPGNPEFGIKNTPRIVGGVDSQSGDRAQAYYARFVEQVVRVAGAREAEMAKLIENTYRHINIALVNELARVCHEIGIDVWDSLGAAATKPFGYQAFMPGPGVGGHCIPIDPNYLSYAVQTKLGYPLRFVQLAQEINGGMPHYVAQRIQNALNDQGKPLRGSRVLLIGVTYKANIADERESPAVPLAARLTELGAILSYYDPHVDVWRPAGCKLHSVKDLGSAARSADMVVVLQHHAKVDWVCLSQNARAILDTRGVLRGAGVTRL